MAKKVNLKRRFLWALVILLALALALLIYTRFFATGPAAASLDDPKLPQLKVAVKNGCGMENLAIEYANHIKDKNLEVVSLGDTPQPIYNKTVIEVKTEDLKQLARLQQITGIKRYTLAADPAAAAPFVIILGEDFEEYMKP